MEITFSCLRSKEIVNIYDDGLTFEPIHRVLFNVENLLEKVAEQFKKINCFVGIEEVSSEKDLAENPESDLEDTLSNDYDVILQVKPEKIPQIKSQIIDGQKCIIIPIDENEQAKVNGLDDLI